MNYLKKFLFVVVCATISFSASAQLLKGAKAYLTPDELPNMIKWLPEPPKENSAAFEYDIHRYGWGKEQRKDA